MEKSKKEQLIRLALDSMENAAAFGAGGLDELTFGALSKYGPQAVQDVIDENPMAAGIGRGASFFVPGFGVAGLLGKGVKLASALNKGSKVARLLQKGGKVERLAELASTDIGQKVGGAALNKALGEKVPTTLLGKMGAGALKGAVGSGAEAAAQEGARTLLGTQQGELGGATSSALMGGGLIGAASPGLERLGKAVYSVPAFKRAGTTQESDELVDFLMKENKFGSLKGFQDYSQKLKDQYGKTVDPLMGKLSEMEQKSGKSITNIKDLIYPFMSEAKEKAGVGAYDESAQLYRLAKQYLSDLGTRPTVDKIRGKQKSVNESLFQLTDPKRRAAMGAGDSGQTTAKIAGFGSQKEALKNWEGNKIKQFLESSDVDAYNKANLGYGMGKKLEKGLEKEAKAGLSQFALPALAGGSYIGAQLLAGQPAPLVGGLGVAGAVMAGRSAPVRTATGLMLNKLGTSAFTPRAIGRGSEMSNRKTKEKEKEKKVDTELGFDPNDPFGDIN